MSDIRLSFKAGGSFAGFPDGSDLALQGAEVAIIGISFITSALYGGLEAVLGVETAGGPRTADSRGAADAIRWWSQKRLVGQLDHYDFDLGGEVLAYGMASVADCGNLVLNAHDAENIRTATGVIKALVEQNVVPVVIGGDHATTIPVLRAYGGFESICVVQVDAHLDWRDEVNGVRDGYSSPMRRVSELPWVTSMIQIGLRGLGSARRQEVQDALAFGSVLVTAEELHDRGMEAILERVPVAENYYISIDIDGLDPAISPGTLWPAPGGLYYYQIIKLLRGLAAKGRIVGMDLVEIVPERDLNEMTSGIAARVILSLIGILTARGEIGHAGID
jgi:agmatinase